MMIKCLRALVLAVVIVSAVPGVAPAGHEMSLGAGVGVAPDYEGSENYQAVPLLMFKSRCDSGRYFEFNGLGLRFNAVPSRRYNLGPIVRYRMARDDVENRNVDALRDVDAALEGGVFASVSHRNVQVGLQWVHDLVDGHGGHLTTPSLGYRWKLSQAFSIVPSVSATYASKQYMHTYFGVDARNRGGNTVYPDYRAGSGWKDLGANVMASYDLNDKWGITALASYSRLQGDAKTSPLVRGDEGRAGQFFGGLMLSYAFGKRPEPNGEP